MTVFTTLATGEKKDTDKKAKLGAVVEVKVLDQTLFDTLLFRVVMRQHHRLLSTMNNRYCRQCCSSVSGRLVQVLSFY